MKPRDLAAAGVTLLIVGLAMWVALLYHTQKGLRADYHEAQSELLVTTAAAHQAYSSQRECFIVLRGITQKWHR